MVEFALVVPILLFLVVIVADFGRVFATGLAMEAAARNAAETVSNAYLANPPSPLDTAAIDPGGTYYADLHTLGARTVCAETAEQPNANFDPGTGACTGMPLVSVCIHDSVDTCGGPTDAQGATIPAECSELSSTMSSAQTGGGARYVEVRVCYRFSSILQLPLLSFGEIWIERTRTFAVPCYYVLGENECG